MPDRKRALVIDDDQPIRMMLAKVVERHDFDVDTARDGQEAIDRLDEDGYDVILLDLMMPRVDGFAVLRHMKQNYPQKLRCTIIASAIPESEILRRFEVPVRSIHSKPFDLKKLMDDVNACVEGSQPASVAI